MHVTSDRSRQLAAMMFAALMLGACGTTPADTQTATRTTSPEGTGISGDAVPGQPSDEHGWQNVGNTVYFETDSSSLTIDAQNQLQKQAEWLRDYPARTVTIEGHADERGTREYNLALGERRANSVANYLVALGTDKSRISVISYGKERPLCADATDECWAQNRRGVSVVNQ